MCLATSSFRKIRCVIPFIDGTNPSGLKLKWSKNIIQSRPIEEYKNSIRFGNSISADILDLDDKKNIFPNTDGAKCTARKIK